MEKITYALAIDSFKSSFDRIKNNLSAKGYPSDWVDRTPVIDSFSFFLPRGKTKSGIKSYLSRCPHYSGRWLCGGFSAVDCSLVDGLLPGLVGEFTCTKNPDSCPVKTIVQSSANSPNKEIG